MTLVNRPSRPHRAFRGFTDEWLTPPEILNALGDFDLDPCYPAGIGNCTAIHMFTPEDDGLSRDWFGRVWLNPPYGPLAEKFMRRMAEHNHGTALIFARTETAWFHDHVWNAASAILFLRGRLHFINVKGERAKGNAGGPSVLVAYGAQDAAQLKRCGIAGRFIDLRGLEVA